MPKAPKPLDQPLKLTVGNLKGGTARSTTAIFLALALLRRTGQSVLVVDADGANGTAYEWSQDAGAGWPSGIKVAYWPSLKLAQRVRESGHAGHIIIDTAPHDADVLRQALSVTDHLVMPIAATPSEARRMRPTLAVAAEIGTNRPIELSVLFTRIKPRTVVLREARAALEGMGLRVIGTDVPFELLYQQSYGTVPNDLGAYAAVLDEILEGTTK